MLANNPRCLQCGHRKSSHYKLHQYARVGSCCSARFCMCDIVFDYVGVII